MGTHDDDDGTIISGSIGTSIDDDDNTVNVNVNANTNQLDETKKVFQTKNDMKDQASSSSPSSSSSSSYFDPNLKDPEQQQQQQQQQQYSQKQQTANVVLLQQTTEENETSSSTNIEKDNEDEEDIKSSSSSNNNNTTTTNTYNHYKDPIISNDEDQKDDDIETGSVATSAEGESSMERMRNDISHKNSKNNNDAPDTILAKNETKAVLRCRILFLIILLFMTIGVSILVYYFTLEEEQDDFVTVYEASSERLVQSFHETLGEALGSLDVLSLSITNHALTTKSEFPNVLIPNFEVLGGALRILMKSLLIVWTPLVSDEQRDSYEAFVRVNQKEPLESANFGAELRARQDAKFGLDYIEPTPKSEEVKHPTFFGGFNDQIYTPQDGVLSNGTGPFVPLLQQVPSPNLIGRTNNIVGPARQATLKETLRTGEAVIGRMNFFDTSEFQLFAFNQAIETGHFRHESTTYDPEEPITPITYPVFDNFNIENRTIVGFLFAQVVWKLSLTNVLPPNVQGIHCVVENSNGQNFTYQVNGQDVLYLGQGDHHDPNYDHMVRATKILDYVREHSSPFNQGYTAVDLNNEFIEYELRIYPSNDMESQYVTNQPMWNALVVASIFVFTSFAFFLYDYLVEKRQAVVMDKAVKSTAVVSSLFPKQVRDRLLEDAVVVANDKYNKDLTRETWKVKLHHKKISGAGADEGSAGKDESSRSSVTEGGEEGKGGSMIGGGGDQSYRQHILNHKAKGKPIADKFESATVMFADLAGFTRWSAEREADQVFTLLEIIYGTLDAIASRRKVFKVETIGDCYMCVTGVPEIQPDHVLRMVKFAKECLSKMETLILELAEELGPDTAELGFRVGLHSGPVTAGVLRGDRSRFQLFGDTVNTAARMESNGEKGRIHLSQSTADELILAGKGDLLQARMGTIPVKGKGEMQTYFLLHNSHPVTTSRTIGEVRTATTPTTIVGVGNNDEGRLMGDEGSNTVDSAAVS